MKLEGLLVIDGFSLGKGRIYTTEYGYTGGPLGPQCQDIVPTLDCISKVMDPKLSGWGHPSHHMGAI